MVAVDSASERIVRRLGRPTAAGGLVVERAALLAEGAHCADIEAWILSVGGEPETAVVEDDQGGGIFADRRSALARPGAAHPTRYVLPAGAMPAQQTPAPAPAPAAETSA